MKRIAILLTLFLTGFFVQAQKPDCQSVQTGKFKCTIMIDTIPMVTLIDRQKKVQIEDDEANGIRMELKIRWTSDCSYELYEPKVIKGILPGVSSSQVIYAKIIAVTRDSYTAEVSSNYSEFKAVMEFFRIR